MDVLNVTLRPRFSRVLTIAVWAIIAASLVSFAAVGDVEGLARYAWPLLLVGFASWVAFWQPRVTISPAGVEFVNLIRTRRITWPAIARIDTKYALTLYTDTTKYSAWAAPAPGRHAAAKLSKTETVGLPESTYGAEDRIGLGDIPTSDSGLAGYYIRRQWEQYREAGLLDRVDGIGVVTTWHRATVIVLVALLVATVLGIVL